MRIAAGTMVTRLLDNMIVITIISVFESAEKIYYKQLYPADCALRYLHHRYDEESDKYRLV